MIRARPAGLVLLTVLSAPAYAEPIPSGRYAFDGDGSYGSVSVIDEVFSIGMGGPGCSGGFTGLLQEEVPGVWFIDVPAGDDVCHLGIAQGQGDYRIDEGPGCTYWHGASCGFSGSMVQTGGSSNASAMQEAFMSFNEDERRAIQHALASEGLYQGGIDGTYGPGTAAAMAQLP